MGCATALLLAPPIGTLDFESVWICDGVPSTVRSSFDFNIVFHSIMGENIVFIPTLTHYLTIIVNSEKMAKRDIFHNIDSAQREIII